MLISLSSPYHIHALEQRIELAWLYCQPAGGLLQAATVAVCQGRKSLYDSFLSAECEF